MAVTLRNSKDGQAACKGRHTGRECVSWNCHLPLVSHRQP